MAKKQSEAGSRTGARIVRGKYSPPHNILAAYIIEGSKNAPPRDFFGIREDRIDRVMRRMLDAISMD